MKSSTKELKTRIPVLVQTNQFHNSQQSIFDGKSKLINNFT